MAHCPGLRATGTASPAPGPATGFRLRHAVCLSHFFQIRNHEDPGFFETGAACRGVTGRGRHGRPRPCRGEPKGGLGGIHDRKRVKLEEPGAETSLCFGWLSVAGLRGLPAEPAMSCFADTVKCCGKGAGRGGLAAPRPFGRPCPGKACASAAGPRAAESLPLENSGGLSPCSGRIPSAFGGHHSCRSGGQLRRHRGPAAWRRDHIVRKVGEKGRSLFGNIKVSQRQHNWETRG